MSDFYDFPDSMKKTQEKAKDEDERTTIISPIISHIPIDDRKFHVIERYESIAHPISRLFKKSVIITFILKNKMGQMYSDEVILPYKITKKEIVHGMD